MATKIKKKKSKHSSFPKKSVPVWHPQTSAETKAMNIEIKRQCHEINKQYMTEADALMLMAARDVFEAGPVRLKRLFDTIIEYRKNSLDYMLDPAKDGEWLYTKWLQEAGVDLEAWYREAGIE